MYVNINTLALPRTWTCPPSLTATLELLLTPSPLRDTVLTLKPLRAPTTADHMSNHPAPTFRTLGQLVSMCTLVSTDHPEDPTCPICQEDYNKGPIQEFALRLPHCGHVFGVSCISAWINGGNNSCPMCRKPILDTLMTVYVTFFNIRGEEDEDDNEDGGYDGDEDDDDDEGDIPAHHINQAMSAMADLLNAMDNILEDTDEDVPMQGQGESIED